MTENKYKKRQKKWIKEFKILYKKHHGCYAQIGKELGVSREAVRVRANKNFLNKKFPPSNYRKINPKVPSSKTSFSVIYKKHKGNYRSITQELGISQKSLKIALAKLGLLENFPPLGKRHTKYTKEQLLKLYKKHKGNLTFLSTELEVAQSNLYRLFGYFNLNLKEMRANR